MNRNASLLGLVGLTVLVSGCAVESQGEPQSVGTVESQLLRDPSAVELGDSTAIVKSPYVKPLPSTDPVPVPYPNVSDVPAPRATAPTYQALATGDGWQSVKVTGTLLDSDTQAPVAADEEVVVIDSPAKLAYAPISASTKQAISTKLATMPAGGAIFVRKSIETQLAQAQSSGVAAFAGCSDTEKTYSKSVSKSKPFSYAQGDETGAFTGSVNVDGTANGNVTASVVLHVDRVWLPIAGCTSYWGSLKTATVSGNADVVANAKAQGHFAKEWHKSKTVVEPVLFNDWVSIGGIPVDVKISLPIQGGIDASAKLDVDMDAHVEAHGAFSIVCTSSDCDGSKSTSFGFSPNKPATIGINARAHIVPWAKAGVKLSLYEGVATGELGVKAKLDSDFWGYYGNTCGDGNADGTAEFVQAATLDARLLVDLEATVALFGADKTYSWSLLNTHLGFWDLLGHSTALDPLVYSDYSSTTLHARMRPCYPYTDSVHYLINWGDGSALEGIDSPAATPFTRSHNYWMDYALTPHSVTVKAVSDAQGRSLNGSTVGKVDPRPTMMY